MDERRNATTVSPCASQTALCAEKLMRRIVSQFMFPWGTPRETQSSLQRPNQASLKRSAVGEE